MDDNIVTFEIDTNASKVHSTDQPFKCPKCTRTFSNVGHLKCHFYRVHSEFRLAACTVSSSPPVSNSCVFCKKDFSSKKELEEHKCTNDNLIPANKCGKCHRVFTRKSSLFRHTVRVHGKSHVCNICDKEFASKSYLNAHSRTHNKSQLIACEICNAAFTSEEALQEHCLTHEKVFKCKVCDKQFGRKCHFVRHALSHKKK